MTVRLSLCWSTVPWRFIWQSSGHLQPLYYMEFSDLLHAVSNPTKPWIKRSSSTYGKGGWPCSLSLLVETGPHLFNPHPVTLLTALSQLMKENNLGTKITVLLTQPSIVSLSSCWCSSLSGREAAWRRWCRAWYRPSNRSDSSVTWYGGSSAGLQNCAVDLHLYRKCRISGTPTCDAV